MAVPVVQPLVDLQDPSIVPQAVAFLISISADKRINACSVSKLGADLQVIIIAKFMGLLFHAEDISSA